MRQLVYLDGAPGGPWMGHALAEIGCAWLAPTQGQVISRAPRAIAAFHGWLAGHGEPRGEGGKAEASNQADQILAGDVTAEIVEIQLVPGFGQSGSAVGFFGPDLQPVTDQDIAATVRRLEYARQDLLEVVDRLPPETLDWRPPGGKRTIRRNLIHVCNCYDFYLSRVLGEEGARAALPTPWPEDTLTCLKWVGTWTAEALANLPANLRSGVFRAEEPDEDWTARKMLRRFVEHELEHLEVVRRTLDARRALGFTDSSG